MADVAIVTDGAPQVAAAAALRLAAQGCDVALLTGPGHDAAQPAAAIAALGRGCLVVAADVADEASVAAAFDRVRDGLGDPTILVNTVCGDESWSSGPQWCGTLEARLRGAFLTSRAALDAMAMAGRGRIVHATDAGGHGCSAVRAGLEGFVRTVAFEVRPWGITVNLVVPAPRELSLLPGGAGDAREDHPEQVAEAVAHLAGPGSAVSGQVLPVG